MRSIGLIGALFVAAAASADPTSPLEFKQFALGMPIAKAYVVPGVSCSGNWENPRQSTCGGPTYRETIAGARVTSLRLYFVDEKLGQISVGIDPRRAEDVAAALQQKYGAAKMTRETLQTRAGAIYENAIWSWDLPAGIIDVKKYAGSIESGGMTMKSNEYTLFDRSEAEERRARNAKDL